MGAIPSRGAKENMEEKKETVGQIVTELATKADNKHSVTEQMRESLTEWERNVLEATEAGLKKYNSDFFVVVLTKQETIFGIQSCFWDESDPYPREECKCRGCDPLLDEFGRPYYLVYHNYYLARKSCPTPEYDQTVYQYIYSADALKYLWTIPDKETCLVYRENALFVVEEEKKLLKYILDFFDGSLDRLCRKLNKEPGDTPYLQNLNVVINQG